jgi:hypothetical protein
MEHARAIVPVGEHALARPALAHDVTQAQLLQLRQRLPLGRRDMGLADVGVGVEDVVVGGRDVHVPAHDCRLRAGGDHLPQRRDPGELVPVVLGVRLPPVGHVDADHPHSAAGGGHRPRFRAREPGPPGEPLHHILQPDA